MPNRSKKVTIQSKKSAPITIDIGNNAKGRPGTGRRSSAKRKLSARAALSRGIGLPEALASVIAPFDSSAGRWPDQFTALSGCCTTRMTTRQTFASYDSSTSTSHVGGFVMIPHPNLSYCVLKPLTGSGNTVSDVNAAGTSNTWGSAPNLTSLIGGSTTNYNASIRCVGMGMRVEYEGTELNRSGRWFAGMIPLTNNPGVVATTGTYYSVVSCTGAGTTTPDITTNIRQSMTNVVEDRTLDGIMEIHWIPNGVPTYQQAWGSSAYTDIVYQTATPGTIAGPETLSFMNAADGRFGVQTGQNLLAFCFQGDTTSSASATSNTYTFELVWHWEVIPSVPYNVVYDLLPSPYNPAELAIIINSVETKPVGFSHAQASDYARANEDSNNRQSGIGSTSMALVPYVKKSASFLSHPTVSNVLKRLDDQYLGGLGQFAGSLFGLSI